MLAVLLIIPGICVSKVRQGMARQNIKKDQWKYNFPFVPFVEGTCFIFNRKFLSLLFVSYIYFVF